MTAAIAGQDYRPTLRNGWPRLLWERDECDLRRNRRTARAGRGPVGHAGGVLLQGDLPGLPDGRSAGGTAGAGVSGDGGRDRPGSAGAALPLRRPVRLVVRLDAGPAPVRRLRGL